MSKCLFTLCLAIAAATTSAWGQSDVSEWKRAFWLNVGAGPGKNGFAVNTDLNLEVARNWALSFRVDQIDETDDSDGASCPDKINSQGVYFSFGRLIRYKRLMTLISAGPGAIDLHHNPCTAVLQDQHHEVSLGVVISAKALVTTKYFGAGINPFVSVNDKRPYYGLTINVAAGRFR